MSERCGDIIDATTNETDALRLRVNSALALINFAVSLTCTDGRRTREDDDARRDVKIRRQQLDGNSRGNRSRPLSSHLVFGRRYGWIVRFPRIFLSSAGGAARGFSRRSPTPARILRMHRSIYHSDATGYFKNAHTYMHWLAGRQVGPLLDLYY